MRFTVTTQYGDPAVENALAKLGFQPSETLECQNLDDVKRAVVQLLANRFDFEIGTYEDHVVLWVIGNAPLPWT